MNELSQLKLELSINSKFTFDLNFEKQIKYKYNLHNEEYYAHVDISEFDAPIDKNLKKTIEITRKDEMILYKLV